MKKLVEFEADHLDGDLLLKFLRRDYQDLKIRILPPVETSEAVPATSSRQEEVDSVVERLLRLATNSSSIGAGNPYDVIMDAVELLKPSPSHRTDLAKPNVDEGAD